MNIEKEIKKLKKQLEELKEEKSQTYDHRGMDLSIEWVQKQVKEKEKNLVWKIIFYSWIIHTAIPMFVFLIGITIGVFLGLE